MGIFDYLRPRRQNGIPRKNTMPSNSPELPSYQNDALDKRHSKLSSMSPNAEQPQLEPNTRPTTSSSWTSILTTNSAITSTSISTSTSTSILTPTTTSHTTTTTPLSPPHSNHTLSNHNLNRPPTPPNRQPPPPSPPPSPPLLPTSEFTLHLPPPPPPPYARLSSRRTDLPLPSYAELVEERQIVPPRPRPRPTPREPPPSFEAAEIQEHDELHADPSRWPGCEYCRVYELWVCYWRGEGVGDVMG
ncbi:hypothetical protein NEUTE1DRAFT_102318 [Neurospora tetrasperma FGSC 2508]|uniref:Uncharacterized protein n=1 Tax=Neurospora tetrasperma (strain FGSC 2508 / ATCC MYA-4615 / P0657) TaxID=510951 RepID=F8MP67_NEUT8|nr:uncharacterized protein NEUTE1DRAFT_102318 [Neurospora tetrasperma FGSC 2508]EGO57079.1 hypothetical protein NEUTE1DRAFT_102318 [Neurospora tetrasperma FGSC 2508]